MKKTAISAVIAVAIIGIILGVLLIVFAQPDIIDTVISVTLIIVGIVTIISNIPGLISGITAAGTKQGIFDIIWSGLGIVLGLILIFNHGTVMSVIVAVYLIIMPIVRIVLADNKLFQFKKELPKLIVGVVIAVLTPGTLAGGATTVICWILRIAGALLILLSLLFAVTEIIMIAKHKAFREPSRIYADTNGDGNIDTVYADTTGDGRIDTEIKIDDGHL